MKLAISNLAWDSSSDDAMYRFLADHEIGLEIAPHRIFQGNTAEPLRRKEEALDWYRIIRTRYKLQVVSMHALLHDSSENLFRNEADRRFLLEYLREGMRFASALECPNVCFGCSMNRRVPAGAQPAQIRAVALDFFGRLSRMAGNNGTCIALEAIPESAGTNFINETARAFELAGLIDHPGLGVGVDLGTMTANGENPEEIFTKEHLPHIRFVHISEPFLAPIRKRELHEQTAQLLRGIGYQGYVSVKMQAIPDIRLVQGALNYFRRLFV